MNIHNIVHNRFQVNKLSLITVETHIRIIILKYVNIYLMKSIFYFYIEINYIIFFNF